MAGFTGASCTQCHAAIDTLSLIAMHCAKVQNACFTSPESCAEVTKCCLDPDCKASDVEVTCSCTVAYRMLDDKHLLISLRVVESQIM